VHPRQQERGEIAKEDLPGGTAGYRAAQVPSAGTADAPSENADS
jgi:hypothetical protein